MLDIPPGDAHEEIFLKQFVDSSRQQQLLLLEKLLQLSKPEVKYEFQLKISDITKFDIISELPIEIAEKIFILLDLSALLHCRQICHKWKSRVSQCDIVWLPYLIRHCIDTMGYQKNEEQCRKNVEKYVPKTKEEELDIIGEKLFSFKPKYHETDKNLYTFNPCASNSFILGRKLIHALEKQAGFDCKIDQDCRGSNVVMTMNPEIIAYAREDRHIVVKYTNFPHKKICVFEAHQCADIKIHKDKLITGGYDRAICIWEWDTGSLVHCLEGSIKPVYSLDVCGDLLVSSDGRCIVTWCLSKYKMFVKTLCFDDSHIEELKVIDPNSCPLLYDAYADLLIVARSSKSLKVLSCTENGMVTFLSNLFFGSEISNLQPFIQIYKHTVACSSDHGVLVWNLVDYTLIRRIERDPCHACQFSARTSIFPRPNNCRVILLYHSETFIMQYFVHKNRFQLFGAKPESRIELAWNFPSDEKWPWSHRKPGLASLVSNLETGFSMNTKLTLFVATQGKKIYCMLFDASDVNYTLELNQPGQSKNEENQLFEDSI